MVKILEMKYCACSHLAITYVFRTYPDSPRSKRPGICTKHRPVSSIYVPSKPCIMRCCRTSTLQTVHSLRTPVFHSRRLSLKLLDARVHLARDKCERHNTRDVHLWAENVHVQAQFLANGLDVLETFLVVGSGTTHPDLDLVLDKKLCDSTESADDTLECACDLRDSVSYLREPKKTKECLDLRW